VVVKQKRAEENSVSSTSRQNVVYRRRLSTSHTPRTVTATKIKLFNRCEQFQFNMYRTSAFNTRSSAPMKPNPIAR